MSPSFGKGGGLSPSFFRLSLKYSITLFLSQIQYVEKGGGLSPSFFYLSLEYNTALFSSQIQYERTKRDDKMIKRCRAAKKMDSGLDISFQFKRICSYECVSV